MDENNIKEQGNISENTNENAKTFDEVLSNKEYQAEFDRRIAKALDTSKAKWEEEYKTKLEAQKTEAEKLAKMNEAEKYKYEIEQEKKKSQDAINRLNAYELKEQAVTMSREKNLDIGLLDLIDFSKENAESVNAKMDNIKSIFDTAVENALSDRLKQKSPTTKVTLNDKIDPYLKGFDEEY